jgi:hypothetical protein
MPTFPPRCAAAARLALAVAAAAAAATALAADPSPPLLGPVATAPFNQTIRVFGFEFNNYVEFFYDATTLPVGSSLSAHAEGQHDEWCSGVAGKEFSEEPCSILDSADTWMYLYFPQSKTCCRACNTTDYCGIISSTWLQDNATYVGTSTIRGVECDGWVKIGGEQNYWYTTVASRNDKFARQPCQYDVSCHGESYLHPQRGAHPNRAMQCNPSRDPLTAQTHLKPRRRATPPLRRAATIGEAKNFEPKPSSHAHLP